MKFTTVLVCLTLACVTLNGNIHDSDGTSPFKKPTLPPKAKKPAEWKIAADCEITLDGRPIKLGDIKSGMKVIYHFRDADLGDGEPRIIIKIRAFSKNLNKDKKAK